jgi:hypothetical protein
VNEQELRALVRDAIARQAMGKGGPLTRSTTATSGGQQLLSMRQHPSHGLCAVPTGADAEGPCVIEPAVPCNHCGYCKSYGH